MNAQATPNMDRDYWLCFVPWKPCDAIVCMTEDEARETVRDYPQYTCVKFNPIEGWSRPMDDEFEDMNVADARLARQLKRHEASYRRPV